MRESASLKENLEEKLKIAEQTLLRLQDESAHQLRNFQDVKDELFNTTSQLELKVSRRVEF